MRFGDVPENDSYDFIGDGIEALIGVPPAGLDHHVWVRLVQEAVPSDPDFPGGLDDMGRRFKAGEIPHWRSDIRIRIFQGPDKGQEKWLRDCSVLVRDEKTGEAIGTLGILSDITAERA